MELTMQEFPKVWGACLGGVLGVVSEEGWR